MCNVLSLHITERTVEVRILESQLLHSAVLTTLDWKLLVLSSLYCIFQIAVSSFLPCLSCTGGASMGIEERGRLSGLTLSEQANECWKVCTSCWLRFPAVLTLQERKCSHRGVCAQLGTKLGQQCRNVGEHLFQMPLKHIFKPQV